MGNASSTPAVPPPPPVARANPLLGDRADAARFAQQAWMWEKARLRQQEAVDMNFDDYIEETNAYVDAL